MGNDPSYAHMAREIAERLVRAGYGIVYGGGSIGLMGVVADAALAAGGEVIGVIPAIADTNGGGASKLERASPGHHDART